MADLTFAKEFGNLLPKFDGDRTKLNAFLTACDNYAAQFMNDQPIVKLFCINIIKNKLVGNANDEFLTSNVENTWNAIREFLISKFGDHANLDVLKNELQFLRKPQSENIIDFIEKIKTLRIRINYRIDSDPMPNEMKLLHKNLISDLSKNVLISNSPIEMQTALLTTENLNFDKAIQMIENYVSQKSQLDMMRSMNTPKYSNNSNNVNMHQNNFRYNNHKQNYNYREKFPSQPINLNKRHIKTHYPTTKQVFGTNNNNNNSTNVFKPNPNYKNTTPPERMSITTRNYPQKRESYSTQYNANPQKKYFSNHNQNTPNFNNWNYRNPHFKVEELDNITKNHKVNSRNIPNRNFSEPGPSNELT